MGMTYTGFGAPVTTKNLQANADLDLGNYDLLATDVKGDTAEFDEFIGGVGNFTNVLGSGNLDIEGTGNVKGLTTFQNGVQVNGALNVGGSINNVNIAANGEITTSQGVNGADFNGAKITSTKFNGATIDTSGNVTGAKGTFSGAVTGASFNGVPIKSSGNISVSPSNVYVELPATSKYMSLTVLPAMYNVTYTGSLIFKAGGSQVYLQYYTDKTAAELDQYVQQVTIAANSSYTLSFNNIHYLICGKFDASYTLTGSLPTLS